MLDRMKTNNISL